MYRVSAYNDSYVYLHNLVTPEHTITRSLPADKSTLNFYGLAIIFEEIVIIMIHTLLDLWTSEFDDLAYKRSVVQTIVNVGLHCVWS